MCNVLLLRRYLTHVYVNVISEYSGGCYGSCPVMRKGSVYCMKEIWELIDCSKGNNETGSVSLEAVKQFPKQLEP